MRVFKITEERKRFVTIFITSILIYSTIAYVSTTPRPKEQFFQLYILGENKMAERYYPNNNPNISPNTTVQSYNGT